MCLHQIRGSERGTKFIFLQRSEEDGGGLWVCGRLWFSEEVVEVVRGTRLCGRSVEIPLQEIELVCLLVFGTLFTDLCTIPGNGDNECGIARGDGGHFLVDVHWDRRT